MPLGIRCASGWCTVGAFGTGEFFWLQHLFHQRAFDSPQTSRRQGHVTSSGSRIGAAGVGAGRDVLFSWASFCCSWGCTGQRHTTHDGLAPSKTPIVPIGRVIARRPTGRCTSAATSWFCGVMVTTGTPRLGPGAVPVRYSVPLPYFRADLVRLLRQVERITGLVGWSSRASPAT